MSCIVWVSAFLIVLLCSPPLCAETFKNAQWLRDPLFEGLSTVDYYDKTKKSSPEKDAPQNVHTYFRKEFPFSGKASKISLTVTGDDFVRVYLNGEQIFQGPAPAYPFHYPFYTLDVPVELLKEKNCLAAHVYYQGLRNRVWYSGDNRSGFVALMEIVDTKGNQQTIQTDGTWKCLRTDAYFSARTTGYETQFLEDIDMRKVPRGWRYVDFDDGAWDSPLLGYLDHEFIPSQIPPLQTVRMTPINVRKIEQGRFLFDFGQELVGCTRITVQGPAGHQIEVRHAEELNEDGTARHSLRAKCEYREFVTLSGGQDQVEYYDYKGFRWIEILHAPEMPEIWVETRHHPFDPNSCNFESSDQLLNDIWRICRNGIRFGTQGVWVDCPTREKGQYLGDAFIASHGHRILTNDVGLSRKVLNDFYLSQKICPGMMAVAPCSFNQEIAEFSLLWPIWLQQYYEQFGDGYFTCRMAKESVEKVLSYFSRFETADGLLANVTEKWVVVDWPANLRDDFDYDYAKSRENAVLNAFYYGSLRAAENLSKTFGLSNEHLYRQKAERLKASFNAKLFNPNTGLYVDAPGSAHSSLHANAIPLYFGLVPPERIPPVIELIRTKRLSCGCYIAPFVIEACFNAGASDLGIDLLRSKDERSWAEMLRHGATTCMEAWGPDQKWNTSWCHPWSSSPIFLITERLVGLRPGTTGWTSVQFSPHIPQDIDWIHFHMTVPVGRILLKYSRQEGFSLSLPPGINVYMDDELKQTVQVTHSPSHAVRRLSPGEMECLQKHHWEKFVGQRAGVWVSVQDQMFRLVQEGSVLWETPCSTAAAGVGNLINSNKTPTGWHSINSKTGKDEPWGRIFRSGKPTKELWHPGMSTTEDLVLTRVLFLKGEEPGKNKGGDVDTFRRLVYIHGTNDEENIGKPTSHGCIRLRNSDAIMAYERIPETTPVLITP